MNDFNLNGLQMDYTKMRQFREFLDYIILKKEILNYHDFRQNCGISRAQWEQFRENNRDHGLSWSVE
jgi:hypothetical protein